jgi:hypothetical protein
MQAEVLANCKEAPRITTWDTVLSHLFTSPVTCCDTNVQAEVQVLVNSKELSRGSHNMGPDDLPLSPLIPVCIL